MGQYLKLIGPIMIIGLTLGGLILVADPQAVLRTLLGANLAMLVALAALILIFFTAQGLRWHFLLGQVGARLRPRDSLLLNMAGQSVSALIPLGDLTRAVFASEATGVPVGQVAATVTVQELGYTTLMLIAATPVLLAVRDGVGLVAATAAGLLVIMASLTNDGLYGLLRRGLTSLPIVRRFALTIDELRQRSGQLLRTPATWLGLTLDGLRAIAGISVVWLIAHAFAPGVLGWWQAAFALVLSFVAGAISFVPGGVGATEASLVAVLWLFHVSPPAAVATAALERLAFTGTPAAMGLVCYLIARRRFPIGSLLRLKMASGPADSQSGDGPLANAA